MKAFSSSVLRRALGVSALASAVTGNEVRAQTGRDTAMTPAQAIMERYVEALGGRFALASHISSHARGRLEVPAQGVSGDMEVIAAAPNRLLVKVEIPGLGLVRSGFDGEVGWSIHPAMGPMVLDGRMLDQMRQRADFYTPLHPELHLISVETMEETEFEDRPCYKLKVVTRWEEEYVEFYDAETGLLAGNIRTQESPMGGIEVTTVVLDYQDFDGIMIPTKVVQRMLGQEQVVTVTSVEYDIVDLAVFELPVEIKALADSSEGAEHSR